MSARAKDWVIGLIATICAAWVLGNIAYAFWIRIFA